MLQVATEGPEVPGGSCRKRDDLRRLVEVPCTGDSTSLCWISVLREGRSITLQVFRVRSPESVHGVPEQKSLPRWNRGDPHLLWS